VEPASLPLGLSVGRQVRQRLAVCQSL